MSQRSSLVHSRIESTPDSGSCSVQLAITCLCLPLYASQCNEELEQDRMESSIVGCNRIQGMQQLHHNLYFDAVQPCGTRLVQVIEVSQGVT